MIELLILAAIVVVTLAALVAYQAHSIAEERGQWREERRFLMDRAIAHHIGEVVALEREDTRKNNPQRDTEVAVRPLMEGL